MRLLLTLMTIVSFLAILASGAYYGYGYGVDLFQKAVVDAQEQLDENAPSGTQATLDTFYYEKNFQSIVVKYRYGDDFGIFEDVQYARVLIPSLEVDQTAYNELTFPTESYELLPEMILTDDGPQIMNQSVTYAIISASVFVGSILFKILFFRKK